LEQIYNAAPHSHPQNLFLIAYFAARASGFYDNVASEPRTRHLPASAIAALGRLGFSTDDSEGNFRIGFEVKEPPDFNAVADLILQALHDAFDARAGVTLLIEAPLAPRPTGKCVPVVCERAPRVGWIERQQNTSIAKLRAYFSQGDDE
jgi:hypothetical protein